MEGRGLSDLYRNTSEEIFLRSYMESSLGLSVPTTMDVFGFKNLSQNFRTDSEELFKSWLTNGENNCFNPPNLAHRTRQASQRISTEITNSTSQQHIVMPQNRRNDEDSFPQNNGVVDDTPSNTTPHIVRNVGEKGLQASELYLAKAWFHSSQPMTRSRSSELRKRYAAMQSAQTPVSFEGLNNVYTNGTSTYSNGLNPIASACEISFQTDTFMSPSNSSSSTFNTVQTGELDRVSSVVSMLKGTLERKKLNAQLEKNALEDESSNRVFLGGEVTLNCSFNGGQRNQVYEMPLDFQEVCPVQDQHCGVSPLDHTQNGFVNSANLDQSTRVSQEPSQSESSAAAPVVSSGLDACDGPNNSGQAISPSENGSRKQSRNSSLEYGSRATDLRERIIGSLKEDRKRGSLQRHGSVTSATSGDKDDATKKRRVERSRKMAEAKERNSTPVISSDMQAVLKRCETLEKEVRSLKLNLSFMNRKDSEQTKQIEELQKQNDELLEEKECLIEEINKIMTETGKI